MTLHFYDFFPVFSIVGLISCTYLAYILSVRQRNSIRKIKKAPFNKFYLKPPGYSCYLKVEELSQLRDEKMLLLILTWSSACLSFDLFKLIDNTKELSVKNRSAAILLVVALIATTVFIKQLLKTTKLLKSQRLGYVAELAIGQELQDFSRKYGAYVFHDFKEEDIKAQFNIDHIVVCTRGVFCFETKGLSKPNEEAGKGVPKIRYANNTLHIPTMQKTWNRPIKQAQINAAHLEKYILQKTGLTVIVHPVVTIPGWFIDVASRNNQVTVLNGINCANILCQNRREVLAQEEIELIKNALAVPCGGLDLEVMAKAQPLEND